MYFRSALLILFITGLSTGLQAQRVKRKGVTVNQPQKKEIAALYSLDQLEGKWQEVKRTPAKTSEPVGFTDSLLMTFNEGKVELKDATSMRMTMRGVAQIDAPNLLAVAGDVYSIRSLDKNTLLIDDGEFSRELQKKEQFYYETVGKIKVDKDSFSRPVTIDINNLKGKWLVYSRQAAPGATNEQTALIKSLEISSISEDGVAFGSAVYYTSNITKTSSCQVVTKEGGIKIVTDQYIWNFYTYKADGREFVFGETGKLVYFAKH